jgi:rhodanese-related sulfurtransferase
MLDRGTLSLIAGTALVLTAAMAAAGPSEGPAVPAEKQTTLGLYMTPAEAYAACTRSPGTVKLLDVRTTEEYLFVGHPEAAWNIPVSLQSYTWDAEKERYPMRPNPDFLTRVREVFSPGDTILVMCRSGTRSARAVDQLAQAGFTHVYNIVEGMEGDAIDDPRSPDYGKRVRNGWKNAGLPWTYHIDPEHVPGTLPAR